MRNWIIIFFLLPISFNTHAIDPQSGLGESGFGAVVSGLAVDKRNGFISGFYLWNNMAMPGRSYSADCTILFSGKYSDHGKYIVSAIDAKSKSPKPVKGQLFFDGFNQFSNKSPVEQNFRLNLLENIDSCSNEVDAIDNEFQLSIQKQGEWNKVTAIRENRAYFHSKPNDLHKRKSYLVNGDLVFVIDETPDWLHVKFFGKNGAVLGWIKRSEVFQF